MDFSYSQGRVLGSRCEVTPDVKRAFLYQNNTMKNQNTFCY